MSRRTNTDRHGRNGRPLSDALRKRIFAALKERGIDDELRHEVQYAATGKASLKDFTTDDARRLLEHLGCRDPRGHDRSHVPARERRRRYTDPRGITHIHVAPTVRQDSIRYAYSLMYDIISYEKSLAEMGEMDLPPMWQAKPGPRLDGWAAMLTKKEAVAVSMLMEEEASRLIVQLRNRLGWLKKKEMSDKSDASDASDKARK